MHRITSASIFATTLRGTMTCTWTSSALFFLLLRDIAIAINRIRCDDGKNYPATTDNGTDFQYQAWVQLRRCPTTPKISSDHLSLRNFGVRPANSSCHETGVSLVSEPVGGLGCSAATRCNCCKNLTELGASWVAIGARQDAGTAFAQFRLPGAQPGALHSVPTRCLMPFDTVSS